MKGISGHRLLAHSWMLPVVVTVMVIAGVFMYRLPGIFDPAPITSSPRCVSSDIVAVKPTSVALEVFGPPGTVASINYLDVNARRQRVNGIALPWTYQVTTTEPAVFVNVVAQGDGDSIGCRITIDGIVKDERSVHAVSTDTSCPNEFR